MSLRDVSVISCTSHRDERETTTLTKRLWREDCKEVREDVGQIVVDSVRWVSVSGNYYSLCHRPQSRLSPFSRVKGGLLPLVKYVKVNFPLHLSYFSVRLPLFLKFGPTGTVPVRGRRRSSTEGFDSKTPLYPVHVFRW